MWCQLPCVLHAMWCHVLGRPASRRFTSEVISAVLMDQSTMGEYTCFSLVLE